MAEQPIDAVLKEAYHQAPPYIQKYLIEGKLDTFMTALTSHFGLHADVAEKVENEILMTVLGMTPPNELPANLTNVAGVAPGLVDPIIGELNTAVFVPLRESLQKTPASVAAPQTPAQPVSATEKQWIDVTPPPAPQMSQPIIPTPVAPTPSTPLPPAPPVYVPPVTQIPVPQPVAIPILQQTPTYQQPVAAPSIPASAPAPEYHEVLSMMRTMSKDIEALKNGVQPQMQPWKPVSVPAEQAVVPTATVPTSFASQPAMHSMPVEEMKTVATPAVHERISVPVQSGGGDPYREPVE